MKNFIIALLIALNVMPSTNLASTPKIENTAVFYECDPYSCEILKFENTILFKYYTLSGHEREIEKPLEYVIEHDKPIDNISIDRIKCVIVNDDYITFKSDDNTVFWCLTVSECDGIAEIDKYYDIYYFDNHTEKETYICGICTPETIALQECECYVYDDIFLSLEIVE